MYIKYVVEETGNSRININLKAIAMKELAKNSLDNSEKLTIANELDCLKYKIRINPADDEEDSIISTQRNLYQKVTLYV